MLIIDWQLSTYSAESYYKQDACRYHLTVMLSFELFLWNLSWKFHFHSAGLKSWRPVFQSWHDLYETKSIKPSDRRLQVLTRRRWRLWHAFQFPSVNPSDSAPRDSSGSKGWSDHFVTRVLYDRSRGDGEVIGRGQRERHRIELPATSSVRPDEAAFYLSLSQLKLCELRSLHHRSIEDNLVAFAGRNMPTLANKSGEGKK